MLLSAIGPILPTKQGLDFSCQKHTSDIKASRNVPFSIESTTGLLIRTRKSSIRVVVLGFYLYTTCLRMHSTQVHVPTANSTSLIAGNGARLLYHKQNLLSLCSRTPKKAAHLYPFETAPRKISTLISSPWHFCTPPSNP